MPRVTQPPVLCPAPMAVLVERLTTKYGRGCHQPATGNGEGHRFKIDDAVKDDKAHLMCHLSVTVTAPPANTIVLEMYQVPTNAKVEKLVKAHGGQISRVLEQVHIKLVLGMADAPFIRELAQAIRRITGRGQRYTNSNWKWVCPRTADSLDDFARVLKETRTLLRAIHAGQ